jgi:CRISPR-associated protein Cas1
MELEMATLYLTEQQSLVKKDGETLVVTIPADEKTGRVQRKVRVPITKIDRVVVQGNSTLTSPAIAAMMERKIEVTFLNQYGKFQGNLNPQFSKNGQLRLAQAQAHQNHAVRLMIAKQFVVGKVTNMRTLIMRHNRQKKDEAIADSVSSLKSTLAELERLEPDLVAPDPTNPQKNSAYGRLHGLEGHASAHYFLCFKKQLKQSDLFNGRTRRPPRDPANALLSYGYTILLSQVSSAICTVGLDPYIGFLHGIGYGKPALALDLMEEFRPIIVDSVVQKQLNLGALKEKDFVPEFGSFRLTNTGRRTFLTALEARFDETIIHPVFNYRVTYRRCIELQARLLAKRVMAEIESYPPFCVR